MIAQKGGLGLAGMIETGLEQKTQAASAPGQTPGQGAAPQSHP
jgi:hypothetical protein